MSHKSVILLSGGLDSVVAGSASLRYSRPLLAITVDYGQKAALAEIQAAAYYANQWGCQHRIVDIPWLGKLTANALTSKAISLPSPNLANEAEMEMSAKKAWIPARNLLLVSIAAAHADAIGADTIVAGWNLEEAMTFSDNSIRFAINLNRALLDATQHPVNLFLPLLELNKTEIVELAHTNNIDLDRVYSCWCGEPQPCGTCESCKRLIRARKNARGRV